MLAVTTTANGFAVTDTPKPVAGPGEVLIRVEAISLNRGEIGFARRKPEGSRIGWDAAGVVEESAHGFEAGERVVAFCKDMTAWAQCIAVPAEFVAPLPSVVTADQAATLPVAGLTALYALDRGTKLLAAPVLVTGASGGVGMFAAQLGQLMGARVIAQIRREEQVPILEAQGIQHVVVSPDGEGLDRHGPYRLIVDALGGPMLERVLPMLDKGGTAVSYAVTAGNDVTLDLHAFFGNGGQRSLYGLTLYTEYENEPVSSGLGRLATLVAERKLRPLISLTADWMDVDDIAREFMDRRWPGKVVLRVG